MTRLRLDQIVVARGLAPSRERARALILAGLVKVNGDPVSKAGAQIDSGAAVGQGSAKTVGRAPDGGRPLSLVLQMPARDVQLCVDQQQIVLNVGHTKGDSLRMPHEPGSGRVVKRAVVFVELGNA